MDPGCFAHLVPDVVHLGNDVRNVVPLRRGDRNPRHQLGSFHKCLRGRHFYSSRFLDLSESWHQSKRRHSCRDNRPGRIPYCNISVRLRWQFQELVEILYRLLQREFLGIALSIQAIQILALLNSTRSMLPGGPAAQAAFDAAVTLAKGKSIQDAAFAAAGRILPPSPYASDALSFVKKVASGQNIQRAALSTVGNFILNKIERQTGPIILNARSGFSQVPSMLTASRAAVFAGARHPRRLTFPGRHRELSEIDLGSQGAQSGKWVRRGDYLIGLGV
jgi:hypothetical protein